MTSLATAFVEVRPDLKGFSSRLKTGVGASSTAAGTDASKKFGSGFVGNATKLAAGAAAVYGGILVKRGVSASIELEAQFSKTLNVMGAVAQVPKKQLGELSDLALKMGQDTVFSANEAADAMLELAKTGISPAVIQSGALKEALTLAAAGGIGMEEAATVMGNALNTFNLKGTESSKVAAALAGAANVSSADIGTLAQGLQQVGTVAADSDQTIQETTAALAALSNAGIAGSDAGTTLKTMFARLQPSTKAARSAFENFGLSAYQTSGSMKELTDQGIKPLSSSMPDVTNAIRDYLIRTDYATEGTNKLEDGVKDMLYETKFMSNAFVKSNGEFKGMAEIAGVLDKKFGDLSSSERAAAFNTLFGSDARRAATVLTKEGTKGLAKYIRGTSDMTAADKAAAAQMKGTAGAIEQRKGSIETLGLAFGLAIAPLVEFGNLLVAKIANKAVPIIEDLGVKLKELIENGPSISELGKKIGAAFRKIDFDDIRKSLAGIDWSAFKDVDFSAFKEAGRSLPTFSDGLNVVAVVLRFASKHVDLLAKALPFLAAGFLAVKIAQSAAHAAAAIAVPVRIAELVVHRQLVRSNAQLVIAMNSATASSGANTVAETANTTAKSSGILASIRSKVATIGKTIAEKAAAVASKALAAATWLVNLALRANPIGIVVTALVAFGAALVLAYKKSETFRKIVNGVFGAIVKAAKWLWDVLFGNSIIPDIVNGFAKAWDTIKTAIAKTWNAIKTNTLAVFTAIRTGIGTGIEKLKTFLGNAWGAIRSGIGTAVDKIKTNTLAVFDGIRTGIGTAVDKLKTDLSNAWNKIETGASKTWGDIKTNTLDFFDRIRTGIGTGIDKLKTALSNAWGDIKSGASKAWGEIKTNTLDFFTGIRTGIGTGIDKLKTFLGNAWDKIETTADKAWGKIVGVIEAAWNGLKKIAMAPITFIVDKVINKGLIKGFNWVVDKVGADSLKIDYAPVPRYAKGGIFPGYTPGRDVGFAAVSGGEAIMRPEWTRAIGKDRIDAMNKAAREGGSAGVRRALGSVPQDSRFASGGVVWPVPGRDTSTYPGHDGVDINRGSGWDDYGDQIMAALGGRVDYVGTARGYGEAIFINTPRGQNIYGHTSAQSVRTGQTVSVGQAIGRVGNTGNSSAPHLHFGAGGSFASAMAFLRGASSLSDGGYGTATATRSGGDPFGIGAWQQEKFDAVAAFGAAAVNAIKDPIAFLKDKIAGPMSNLAGSPIVDIIKSLPGRAIGGVADHIKDKLSGYLTQSVDSSSPGGTKSLASYADFVATGGLRAMVAKVAAGRGWGDAGNLGSWNALISQESSWRPTAQNKTSTAYGLGQFLDSTWGTVGGSKTSDPARQIEYMARYIEQKYDNPVRAWDFHNANNWYDGGGVGRGRGLLPKITPLPERVLSPRQTSAFEKMMDRGGLNGGGRQAITITNWREGTGWIEQIADGSINADRDYSRTLGRQGVR